jgi:glutathione S-transferase
MLKVHHLNHSQSERIVWLCEELRIPYELIIHTRDPDTLLAPMELKSLHPLGSAPVIEDGDLVMAESAAIVEYLIVRHGGHRLKLGPGHPEYAAFLYWFHFANGNLQPAIIRLFFLERAGLSVGNQVKANVQGRLDRVMAFVEDRLGQVRYFAGKEFTAADIMIVVSLTTMRLFLSIDLAPYSNIRAYLQRIGERAAYRRALAKSDPDLVPMLS